MTTFSTPFKFMCLVHAVAAVAVWQTDSLLLPQGTLEYSSAPRVVCRNNEFSETCRKACKRDDTCAYEPAGQGFHYCRCPEPPAFTPYTSDSRALLRCTGTSLKALKYFLSRNISLEDRSQMIADCKEKCSLGDENKQSRATYCQRREPIENLRTERFICICRAPTLASSTDRKSTAWAPKTKTKDPEEPIVAANKGETSASAQGNLPESSSSMDNILEMTSKVSASSDLNDSNGEETEGIQGKRVGDKVLLFGSKKYGTAVGNGIDMTWPIPPSIWMKLYEGLSQTWLLSFGLV